MLRAVTMVRPSPFILSRCFAPLQWYSPPPFIFSRCFAPLPWCSFPPLHPLAMLRTVAMVLPPFHSLAMVLAVTILLIPPPSSSRDTSCRYHGTHSPSFILSRYFVPLPRYSFPLLHRLAILGAVTMVLPPPFILSRCFSPLPWSPPPLPWRPRPARSREAARRRSAPGWAAPAMKRPRGEGGPGGGEGTGGGRRIPYSAGGAMGGGLSR